MTTKSISDTLIATPFLFQTQGFQGIDAEESVAQLVRTLWKNSRHVVPVLDPEHGQLISLLSPLDVLHLLDQIAQINEPLFCQSIAALNIGTYTPHVKMATKESTIRELLETLDAQDLSAVPVVESESSPRVVGVYHKCDVSFITKAPDPEAVLQNLRSFRVEDAAAVKDAMLAAGEISTSSAGTQGLVTVQRGQSLSALLRALVQGRSHRAFIVDEVGNLQGVVSFRDLLQYFLELDSK